VIQVRSVASAVCSIRLYSMQKCIPLKHAQGAIKIGIFLLYHIGKL
jgi:hypothetical protein